MQSVAASSGLEPRGIRMQSVEKIKADLKEAKEAGDISLEEFLAELKKLRPIVADRPADARKKNAHCMHLHPHHPRTRSRSRSRSHSRSRSLSLYIYYV